MKFIKSIVENEITIFIFSIVLGFMCAFALMAFVEIDEIDFKEIEYNDKNYDINVSIMMNNKSRQGFYLKISENLEDDLHDIKIYDVYLKDLTYYFGLILFSIINVVCVIYISLNYLLDILYRKYRDKKVYENFETPKYSIIIRLYFLIGYFDLLEMQKRLKAVNLNENKNLIYENIDKEEELYKMVMNYKHKVLSEESERQNYDIQLKFNQEMRKQEFFSKITINDILLLGDYEKIKAKKDEVVKWLKRIVIEICVILLILRVITLINIMQLSQAAMCLTLIYFIKRCMTRPFTKKAKEEMKKIKIYNKVFEQKIRYKFHINFISF